MFEKKRTVIVVMGLQRSGNHALIAWLGSLFPSHTLFNDNRHDLFSDPEAVQALIGQSDEDCLIFSFEDSAPKLVNKTAVMTDSVIPFPEDRFPGFNCHYVFILRDPYNLWASRLHGRAKERNGGFGDGLTSNPSWEHFRRNWMALAKQQHKTPDTFVLFNKWVNDKPYRQQVCARLGGVYSEATLHEVATAGAGSSFEGVPRPTYIDMVRNWRHYVEPSARKRLMKRPLHYLKKLIKPRMTAKELQVDQRWKTIVDRPDSRMLFADPDMRAEALRIFGKEQIAAIPLLEETGTA